LRQILAGHPRPAEILRAGQFSTDPEVAATAVIGLARLHDKAVSDSEILSSLLVVCQNNELAMTTRAAAWESVGHLSSPEAANAVNEHWDNLPAIDQTTDWETQERWIARAKHHPPRQDSHLHNTFASASAPLQALILDLLYQANGIPLAPQINDILTR